MYRLKIAGTDQVSFGLVPVLMVVKISWSTVFVNKSVHKIEPGNKTDVTIIISYAVFFNSLTTAILHEPLPAENLPEKSLLAI